MQDDHSHDHDHALEHAHDHDEKCCDHDHGTGRGEEGAHGHSHDSSAAADISDAAADLAISKTVYSQELKGSQSYYYWHGDAERRRVTGEQPVPVPLPKKLASSEKVKEKRIKAIEKHQFLDDSDIVKVFIPLEGELEGVAMKQVEAEFQEQSLMVTIELDETIHRFWIDRLAHAIDPLRSKVTRTKSGKLVIKLYKRNHLDHWRLLRGVA